MHKVFMEELFRGTLIPVFLWDTARKKSPFLCIHPKLELLSYKENIPATLLQRLCTTFRSVHALACLREAGL